MVEIQILLGDFQIFEVVDPSLDTLDRVDPRDDSCVCRKVGEHHLLSNGSHGFGRECRTVLVTSRTMLTITAVG
jgi:hypothetical protein